MHIMRHLQLGCNRTKHRRIRVRQTVGVPLEMSLHCQGHGWLGAQHGPQLIASCSCNVYDDASHRGFGQR